jgi:TonB-dependent SusC/RagA subfamily outer membrane receptor
MNFIEIKENSKPVLIHLRASKSKSSKKVGEVGKPWKIDSKVSVASVEFETDTPSENSEQITAAKAQGNPLIFIDGKMQKVSINIKDIDPNEIARISLVSGEDPVKIYGKKAKDGLVLITSKKAGNKMSRYMVGKGVQVYNTDKFSKNDNSKWAERAIGKRDYYPIGNISSSTTIINRKDSIVNTRTSNGNKITIISNDSVSNRKNYKMVKLDSVININASNIPNSTSFYIRSGDKRPLIIIDGIIKEDSFDLDEISPSAIESMNVLKDQSAIKKYGKKAENGVIEITLKEKK